MAVKLTVFEYLLYQFGDKQTVTCFILAKQHKISFFISLLAIAKHLLNLTQKVKVIRIVIISAAFLLDKTL